MFLENVSGILVIFQDDFGKEPRIKVSKMSGRDTKSGQIIATKPAGVVIPPQMVVFFIRFHPPKKKARRQRGNGALRCLGAKFLMVGFFLLGDILFR